MLYILITEHRRLNTEDRVGPVRLHSEDYARSASGSRGTAHAGLNPTGVTAVRVGSHHLHLHAPNMRPCAPWRRGTELGTVPAWESGLGVAGARIGTDA